MGRLVEVVLVIAICVAVMWVLVTATGGTLVW